jgi:hypothetical protein
MIPTLVPEPFHRPGWIYEEKVDGWRILAYKDGGRVRLVSNRVDHARGSRSRSRAGRIRKTAGSAGSVWPRQARRRAPRDQGFARPDPETGPAGALFRVSSKAVTAGRNRQSAGHRGRRYFCLATTWSLILS